MKAVKLGVEVNSGCAACGMRLGNHLLSQYITCRAKLGLMPSLIEMFPPKKNQVGQWTPQGIVISIVVLIIFLVILRAFGII